MSAEKANEQIGSPGDTEKKNNTKKVIVISGVVIVCIGAIIVLLLLLGKTPDDEFNTVVTKENVQDAIRQLNEKDVVPIGSYEVVMNTDWVFPDGSSPSTNAYVENCINNQSTVFFTIEHAGGDGTVIYTSPYLKVGDHIEDIKLDNDLAAGTYDTVLTYHLVDDEYQEISHVSVSVTITVQN